jgi:TonB family protein
MAKTAYIVLATCLLASSLFADGRSKPVLESSQTPRYPAIAATAHVEGSVEAEFTLDGDGNITFVRILSGPALLARATEDNIRTWKFSMPPKDGGPDRKYKTTFSYHISGRYPTESEPLRLTITFVSFEHVEITTDLHYRPTSY